MAIVGKFQYTQADQVLNSTTFVTFTFKQKVRAFAIENKDGAKSISISLNGTDINETAEAGERVEFGSLVSEWYTDVSLKSSSGTCNFRLSSAEKD